LQVSGLYFYGSGQRYSTNYGGDQRRALVGSGRLRPDGTIAPRNNLVGSPIHRVDMRLQERIPHRSTIDRRNCGAVQRVRYHANYGAYTTSESNAAYGKPAQSSNVAYAPRESAAGIPRGLLMRAPIAAHACAVRGGVCCVRGRCTRSGKRRARTTFGGCPLTPAQFYPCAVAKMRQFNPPRTADGLPDLSGFWSRAVTTEDIHERGEVVGQSAQASLIVDPSDGRIPYLPWAAAQKQTNARKYISPLAFCDVPGIPRSSFHTGSGRVFGDDSRGVCR
jgi:hypothetical protein